MEKKPLKPITEKEEKKIRKEFTQAANNINSACRKRGEELVKEAVEFHSKKKEDSKKSTDAIAKDVASYAVGIARGRITTHGLNYCCFDCVNHVSNHKEDFPVGQYPCAQCQNGSLFEEIRKEEMAHA